MKELLTKMKRALIYGIGNNFIYSCKEIEDCYRIVGLIDNDLTKQGTSIFGYSVKKLTDYQDDEYDLVIVTPNTYIEIVDQLNKEGFDSKRIINIAEALSTDSYSRVSIAIILYGGMGDYIIGKNWLYHLDSKYSISDDGVHIYCAPKDVGIVNGIFSDCRWIRECRAISTENSSLINEEFDLIFRFSIFPFVQFLNDSAVFMKNPGLYEYSTAVREYGFKNYNPAFFASPDFYKTVGNIFSNHPKRKYHTHFDVLGNLTPSDDYLCEIPMLCDEDEQLSQMGLCDVQFITLDTGLNNEYRNKCNTRAWSFDSWNRLGYLIKKEFPDIKIVQIGLATGAGRIKKADIDLSGATDIEQAKVLMKYSKLHVDYDGGLVHLRHVLHGGPTIVIFGPTGIEKHNYSENIAIRSSECIEPCEWTRQDWLVKCKKGCEYPECMKSVTPEIVMEKVKQVLDQ